MMKGNKNIRTNWPRTCTVWLAIALLAGCATKRVKETPPVVGPPEKTVESPIQAPQTQPPKETPQAPLTPPPTLGVRTLPPITVVLGGAGVASFAAVGVLKRLQEEGVKIDSIIATGWPAVFAVGFGALRTVHDLEWFAGKLEPADFSLGGYFSSDKGFADHDKIQNAVQKAFGSSNLGQTRVPIVLSTSNSQTGAPEVFSTGNWVEPLLKAISVPGTFRPYGDGAGLGWISHLSGLDVDEAARRGARVILAFNMYEDYFEFQKDQSRKNPSAEALFRNLYLIDIEAQLKNQSRKAHVVSKIRLGRPPADFNAKRVAIQLGYQEAQRILRQLVTR